MRARTTLDAAVMVLATARLARLVTDDRIAAPLRDAVGRRFGNGHPLTYLVNCPICVSVWAGAAVVWVVPPKPAWALGLSEAAIRIMED